MSLFDTICCMGRSLLSSQICDLPAVAKIEGVLAIAGTYELELCSTGSRIGATVPPQPLLKPQRRPAILSAMALRPSSCQSVPLALRGRLLKTIEGP